MFEFLDGPESVTAGKTYEIEGIRVAFQGMVERRALGATAIITFVLGYGAGKVLDPFVDRLIRVGQHRIRRLFVDGSEVPLEKDDILEVLRRAQDDEPEDGS